MKQAENVSIQNKVIITSTFPQELVEELQSLGEVFAWKTPGYDLMPRDIALPLLADATALINVGDIHVNRELLDVAPRLKIVANVAIGYDNVDVSELTRRGIWLTNTPDYFSYPVVEIVIAGMICVSRRLTDANDFVRDKAWTTFEPGRWDGFSLKDRTLGIVGYGKIGRALRPIAEALGMTVLIHDILPTDDNAYCPLEELDGKSDFISVHIPLNQENLGLFNKEVFSKMKPGSVFINASRGGLVVERDLINALQSGHLHGAVLDVFEKEPYISPELLNMKQVFLTPHLGGGTVTSRFLSRKQAVENVKLVLNGNKPLTPVNSIQ